MKQEQFAGAPPERSAPKVHNGTYTVDHPDRGHFTVKLYTAQDGSLAGNRLLALLVGPDNVSDYKPVAFWDDAAHTVRVWRRFGSDRDPATHPIDGYNWSPRWSPVEQKLAIWCDLATRGYAPSSQGLTAKPDGERGSYWHAEGYRMLLEGRCSVCNRPLTDPDSIRLGIGPTCGGRA